MPIDETVGSIGVDITADYSGLLGAIDEATRASEKGSQAIADAFNKPEAGDTMAASLDGVGAAAEHAGHSAHEASEGFGSIVAEGLKLFGIVFTLEKLAEGLKEITLGSIEAFAEFQRAEIALTAMMGSAEQATEALENLKGLAMTDALSFPSLVQATQRLTAFGIEAEQIPRVLQAAADASAATGNAFDSVAGAIERLSLSGNAGSRQLVQLGLSTQDLARAMNISAASVKDAFKEMDPTERVGVIIDALQKFSGVAEKEAESISGQWQKLKNVAHFTFEDIGTSVQGAASSFTAMATVVLEKLDDLIKKYGELQKAKRTNLDSQAEINKMMLGEAIGLDAAAGAIKRLSDANLKQNESMRALGGALLSLSPEVSEAEKKQSAAAEAVERTSEALAEEKARLDAGKGSWDAYVRLANEHTEALEKLHPKLKETEKDFGAVYIQLAKFLQVSGWIDQVGFSTTILSSEVEQLQQHSKLFAMSFLQGLAAMKLPLGILGVDMRTFAFDTRTAAQVLSEAGIKGQAAFVQIATALQADLTHLHDLQDVGFPISQADIDAIAAALANVAKNTEDVVVRMSELGKAAKTTGEIMAAAGVKSKESLEQQYAALVQLVAAMERVRDESDNWTSTQDADLDALKLKLKELLKQLEEYGKVVVTVHAKTDIWTREFESAIKSVSDEFGRLIVQGGNFGDAMLKILDSIAAKIISTLVQAAFGSLLQALGKTIGQMGTLKSLFHDIFGSVSSTVGGPGGTSGFAGPVSGISSAAGGVASGVGAALGGVMGIVGAIGSIGSMISGIIGNFQQAHANRLLAEIEESTRYSSIIAQQLKPYFVEYLPMLGVLAGVGNPGAVTGLMGNDHADLVNIANILTTMLTVMRIPNIAGGVLKPGLYSESQTTAGQNAGVTVNMYVTSSDPTNIARKLATMLRGRGIIFTPA